MSLWLTQHDGLALYKHGQTKVSQGHLSVTTEVYDSGIVSGISPWMLMAVCQTLLGISTRKTPLPLRNMVVLS